MSEKRKYDAKNGTSADSQHPLLKKLSMRI
jgi:hypothetical protein